MATTVGNRLRELTPDRADRADRCRSVPVDADRKPDRKPPSTRRR
jgi:hypothetical protein